MDLEEALVLADSAAGDLGQARSAARLLAGEVRRLRAERDWAALAPEMADGLTEHIAEYGHRADFLEAYRIGAEEGILRAAQTFMADQRGW